MLKKIILEMSLKPFKITTDEYIDGVVKRAFTDWRPLLDKGEEVGIMFYIGDGSEILEYNGDMSTPVEWCQYMGTAIPTANEAAKVVDPRSETMMTRGFLYIPEPPTFTLGTVKRIIASIKRIGKEMTGKRVVVGEMFDPGNEFVRSNFKLNTHPEASRSEYSEQGDMLCCYSRLNGDNIKYAAYPCGIPDGTPFGSFFGKQCAAFFSDMDFDFLWLSNGFGFGIDTWSSTGAVFDGESFHGENLAPAKEKNIEFWRLFREAAPGVEIQTRGTNMSTGIDYASDAVPLKEIYEIMPGLIPPPNSPWASIDGDFGLELVGFMSRVAKIPDNRYQFRYYVHDPWFMNSPWYDRYEGQPHDIYLPLSCARMDEKGQVMSPTDIHIFAIDNCLGEMPEACITEPIPHLLKAIKDMPDAPSPLVWVYPFDEYLTADSDEAIKEMYSGDWFVRGAINNGLPLSTVISTDNLVKALSSDMTAFEASVLFSPVPDAKSEYERAIIDYVKLGGKAIFYGTTDRASDEFLKLVGVSHRESLEGEMALNLTHIDDIAEGNAEKMKHRSLVSAGGATEVLSGDGTEALGYASDRLLGTLNGNVAWVRGVVSSEYKKGQQLLVPDDPCQLFQTENMARYALCKLGTEVSFGKDEAGQRSPVIMCSRSDNAFIFSTYSPDTTVDVRFRFPLGAPILMGYETKLEGGRSTYRFPRAEHRECRVFVEQSEGRISCRECAPVDHIMRRRIELKGLKNATVRFFAEDKYKDGIDVRLNSEYPHIISEKLTAEYVPYAKGGYYELKGVTGSLLFSMHFLPARNFQIIEL